MCGIAGTFSQNCEPLDLWEQFGKLMIGNTNRGGHSFGVLQVSSPEPRGDQCLYRTVVTRRFGKYSEHTEAQISSELTDPAGILGHTRTPTGRYRDDARCIHPLCTSRFFFAHNGIILNSDHLLKKFSTEGEGPPVDSWAMLAGIHNLCEVGRYGVVQAIQLVCDETEGQFACWLLDSKTSYLYLFRQMSPIHLALPFVDHLSLSLSFRCPGFVFSSNDFKGSTHKLEEGKIVCFAGGKIGAVGQFQVQRHV